MDLETLANQAMPYITAAVRSYGATVLTRAEDTSAGATVNAGQRLIHSLLTSRAGRPGIEQAVTALAAHPDDSDFAAALRAQMKLALRNDEKLAGIVESLLPSRPSTGQRSLVMGGGNRGQISFGDNSPNVKVTKRKFLFLPFGLIIRLTKSAASAHPVATAVCSVLVVSAVAGTVVLPNLSANAHPSSGTNLITDPGAEQAVSGSGGGQVLVPGWSSASGSTFTAVAYGASGGFPDLKSPGPADRGKNLFAGGPGGATSMAEQTDSVEQYRNLINSGKARFALSAWLGGYAEQGDYATLTVTWQTSAGATLGQATIGPVTEAQRSGVTEMLFRSVSGTVPAATGKARLTLSMIREAGEYNDGYADDLTLKIS
jgi:hypothetical protein